MTEVRRNNTVYRIRVIDTVGLCDNVDAHELGTMQALYRKLEEHFKNHLIVGANLILFVCKKTSFSEEERSVFTSIESKFEAHICPFFALVVTGCETQSTDARKSFLQEFKGSEDRRKIAGRMKKGIYAVGFPPLKEMPQHLQEGHKPQIKTDKETLMDLIIECENVHFTKKLFEKPWSCTIL